MDPMESQQKQGHVLAERYEILSEIGRGGFGMVYRARQLNVDREVAIKVLPPQFMAVADVVERFKREAKLTSQLTHPNTITIHDYGQADNLLYIVMELLEGEDLADLLKKEPTLPLERILPISQQILRSLGEAHGKGIVHRDLKPENVFLCDINEEEDFVKILDFGIAKLAQPDGSTLPGRQLTVSGSTVGTPVYMSPEQAAGEEVDHLTDLYALGIMMYEMACGHPPFFDDNPVKIMRSHLFQEVPPFPKTSEHAGTHLERVILHALQKEKALRYQSAREFLLALEHSRPKIMALPSSLLSALPPATRKLTPPQLEDDLPTIELSENSDPSEEYLDLLPSMEVDPNTGAYASTEAKSARAMTPADAVPFDALSKLSPPEAASRLAGASGEPSPAQMDFEEPEPPEGFSGAGLNTSSAILSIIEHTSELQPQQDEDVIVLTKPKKPSNAFKREDLDVGQEGQAPVSFGSIEVTDSLELPAQPRSASSSSSLELKRVGPATSPPLDGASRESVGEASQAGASSSEGEAGWSWDPHSTPDARALDSGAYPQLKQKQEASLEARKKPARMILLVLIPLLLAALIYALYVLGYIM